MRLRRWGATVLWVMACSACRPPAAPIDPAFRSLSAVSVSDAATLPEGQLRLSAYVVDVGMTTDGTFLKLSDSPTDAHHMILVYGSPVDMIFAQHLKGQRADLEFKVLGRTKLADGSAALLVSITGLRANVESTPSSP